MPKITTNQPLISHFCSSFSQNIGQDLLHLNISTTPDAMTVHHYSLHPRPVIAQFSQERVVGEDCRQTQRDRYRTERGCSRLGVHGTTGVGVGLGAGEGEEAASLTPPPPSVNRRLTYANGVMHSRVDISWDPSAVVVLGRVNMCSFGVH